VTQDQANRLGEYIRERRLEAQIGLRELAGRCEISPANLHKIEAGDIKEPSALSLQRIALQLGCPYEDLAALVGYPALGDLPSLPVYLRTRYDDLSSDEIREVERFVRFIRQGSKEGDDDGQPSR